MDEFGRLNDQIKESLSEFGFKKPTPIQERAIPQILEGENSLLIAPTGTGKTEAALFPIFSQFIEEDAGDGINIVYIAPLRALNRDMLERLRRWREPLGLDIQVRHGDTTKYQRRKQALNPPDMLITTPETLQAILPGSRMKEHLKSVKWVIIDEVHELAESKRGTQLSLGLERMVRLAGNFQRVGLSATVGSVEEIADFLVGTDLEVEVLDTSTIGGMTVNVESPMPTEEDAELSEELNAQPTMIARLRRIRDLIKGHESTLTFVNTREASETLGSRLKFWVSDFPVSVHHGSLSREFRISAEEEFRKGNLKSLICTSSMELGIDIGTIDFVIQYMSPRQVTRLIQRIGRSGHEIGGTSEGVVIAADPDDVAESGIISERTFSGCLERTKIHENSLDVLAHQLVGMNLDGIRKLDEAFELVRRAYPYREISRDDFIGVLRQLLDRGLIWRERNEFGYGRRSWKYYYDNLSMIPDTRRYQIRDLVSGESIGTLDEEFVVAQAEPGVHFICKGETWQVVELEEDQVRVEPIDDPYGAIPAWEGELIPVPFEIARDVGDLRSCVEKALERGDEDVEIAERLVEDYPLERDASEWLVSYLHDQFDEAVIPTADKLVIETYENFGVLHAPFGTVVNKTLAQILAALISTRIGASVGVKSDPYRVAFRFPERGDFGALKKTLGELEPEHIEPLLKKILENSSVFRWRLLHIAKRFGAISKDADFSKVNVRRMLDSFEGTPLWKEAEKEVRLEKLDVSKLTDLLRSFKEGEFDLELVGRSKSQGPTPMGLPILNELAGAGELVVPERAEREILKVLERRLRNSQVKLFCMNCKEWSNLTKVRRLSEEPICGNCGARLLALVPLRRCGVIGALRKEGSEELSEEEEISVRRAKETANLVLTYGKSAVVAMAARGVGPSTATRILAKQHKSDEDFYRDILRAERVYARTHRFWDSK